MKRVAPNHDYVISLHQQVTPTHPEAAQLAFTTILRRKGRILDAVTNSFQRLRQNLSPDEQPILDEYTAAQSQLAALLYEDLNDKDWNTYHTQIESLQQEIEHLENDLARRSTDFQVETESIEIDAIQILIPDDAILMEFVSYEPIDLTTTPKEQRGNPRYAAYLLFPDGRIETIDLGDAAEIDAAIQSFVGLIQNRNAGLQRAGAAPTIRPDVVNQVTSDINTLVFDPIAPYLEDTDHLLISPDGQLNLLPFEALQPEAGGDYLIQQYQISYLNSGRDLLKFDLIEPSTNPAVIVANPDYEVADDTVVAQGRSTGDGRRSTELNRFKVEPLPGTGAEAEAIRPLLPNADIHTEDEATENLLKSVQSPRILHIATHGFFLPDVERPETQEFTNFATFSDDRPFPTHALTENPLLRSGLALAGFNTRTSGSEDGVFTALEASQLNLFGTQLVVLSACETGLGDIANGEGVYGLRRAFALAGAESQLMSLWQVSDYGTQSLMARYYEKLTAGMGRSEALREVQLEMIEQGGQYSHPYYWAAFILAGDWRPLE